MNSIRIHLEPIVRDGDGQFVVARVEGVTSQSYRLWFRIPADHAVDQTAMAHAFVVSVINQAMAVGRDVVIDAPVPRGFAMNMDEYQRYWCTSRPGEFKRVELRPSAVVDDEPFRPGRGAVVSYSGGIDSLFSAKLLAEKRELGALVLIRGLDISLANRAQWLGVLTGARKVAQSLGAPLLTAGTNWEDIAPKLPGYFGYFAPIVAVPILLSSRYGYAAAPSSFNYGRLYLLQETNPISDPLLGRPGFPVLHHGAWARRIEKVAAIASWPVALEHLRPCYFTTPNGTACGKCNKCIHTALAFSSLGLPIPRVLGGMVPSAVDIANIKLTPTAPYAQFCLQNVVDTAKQRGMTDRWIADVERKLAERTAVAAPPSGFRRRLNHYVLAGPRLGPRRVASRIAQIFRHRATTPGPQTSSQFAVSPGGRHLYIDQTDVRGASLVGQHGNLYPTALRIWRGLVASQPWTHIVDVGANYGEMIIDIEAPASARVIAVEPNPYIRRHLEKSVQEAELAIKVVSKAISDREGSTAFTLDRTWSGMSSVSVHPDETAGHRLETLQVETTTLRGLLDDGSMPDRDKRVLVKIDVEGHELSVLRGLGDAADRFADFAALMEIRHLPVHDLAELMDKFVVELFDEAADALVAASAESADHLSLLLQGGRFYREDAVLRPRRAAMA